MTRVAILWHMHQPYYEDLATHEHVLPWVRLHALKDYYGMAALLREFPAVKVTFNLVPSLLVQLEAFAADRARDRFLELSLKPADQLDAADVAFVLENFFHAQRQRMIDIYPRYAELLARRDTAARFTHDDLRDLQVWHKLAWIDPLYLDGDDRVRGLVAKGRDFSEDDKQTLRAVEMELLNAVIPEYRDGAARGQIEIAASPFYHPILPLLCDTEVYRRTHPDVRVPRFQHPEDAAEQLTRAAACHERLFGRRPAGLWPSEGSVSDAMVPLAAAAGFTWMATDEGILARTLGVAFSRDGAGQLEQPERLYTPYRIRAGSAVISTVFRDHTLSDLIGFTYSGWPADRAADDMVARLVEAGRRYRERANGADALIPIVLDGENAWEYFEGGGRPFLRALYARLANHPELRTVTMTEACAAPGPELPTVFPGSWIDSNFYIWIGHPDDRRAWSQLAAAREALERANGVDAAALAEAREEVLIAEGSDWFWWYGDDHSSAHDQTFDDLFRRHLRHAYRCLGQEAPGDLYATNITTAAPATGHRAPTMLLAPTIDGEETSYFEWLGAGEVEFSDAAGAMQRSEAEPPVISSVLFGSSRERLFVRVDGPTPFVDVLAGGREVRLAFLTPAGVRFSIRQVLGRLTGTFAERASSGDVWTDRGPGGAALGAGGILELAIPFADLGLSAGQPLAFFVIVADGDVEVARQPAAAPIELTVPGADFEARQWRA